MSSSGQCSNSLPKMDQQQTEQESEEEGKKRVAAGAGVVTIPEQEQEEEEGEGKKEEEEEEEEEEVKRGGESGELVRRMSSVVSSSDDDEKSIARADLESLVDTEKDRGSDVTFESASSYPRRDYSGLAAKLRTQKHAEMQPEVPSVNPLQYWQENVRDEESAFRYFQLFHPEYPETLQRAMVGRLSQIIKEAQEDPDKEIPKKLRYESGSEKVDKWDYKKELEMQGVKTDFK